MNNRELEEVSKLEPFKRYQYFIKKIADYEEVWTIIDVEEDYALCDIGEYTLISLWPNKEFIGSNLNKQWSMCKPLKLTLDDLYTHLYPLITKEGFLLNVFPINGKAGFIVSLEEFNTDLNEELENYQ